MGRRDSRAPPAPRRRAGRLRRGDMHAGTDRWPWRSFVVPPGEGRQPPHVVRSEQAAGVSSSGPMAPPLMRVVLPLGVAQTISWGSTYYLPAILATAMAADIGVSTASVFAAFSGALLASA